MVLHSVAQRHTISPSAFSETQSTSLAMMTKTIKRECYAALFVRVRVVLNEYDLFGEDAAVGKVGQIGTSSYPY